MSYKVKWAVVEGYVKPKMADTWLEDRGPAVLDLAQALVPVDTGHLRNSGYYRRNGVYDAEVGFSADYAGYVEYGTRYMFPQPFLRPALLIA